jgi:hypothetical protein
VRERDDLWKNAVVGAAAGVIASLAVNGFQALWNAAQTRITGEPAEGGEHQDDPSPVKAADRVSRLVAGATLPEAGRERAGVAVHYATGAGLGALYGLLAAPAPAITAGYGTAYGAATALALDWTLVPALGLSPAPRDTPVSKHFYSLASHLVFGLALEGARRVVGSMLERPAA